MMGEINNLTAGSTGVLDVAAAETTVDSLLFGGDDPVITERPTGAWTSVITNGL
jgi:NitT/TauT family transport system substrate-binding protein